MGRHSFVPDSVSVDEGVSLQDRLKIVGELSATCLNARIPKCDDGDCAKNSSSRPPKHCFSCALYFMMKDFHEDADSLKDGIGP